MRSISPLQFYGRLSYKKMNYSEQLKSPLWQKKRLEIMQRDNFTCQDCGDTESQLQVHHKSYTFGNNVWEYDNDNLITLCETCHSCLTDLKKIIKLRIDNEFLSTDQLNYVEKIISALGRMDLGDIAQVAKFTDYIFELKAFELNDI